MITILHLYCMSLYIKIRKEEKLNYENCESDKYKEIAPVNCSCFSWSAVRKHSVQLDNLSTRFIGPHDHIHMTSNNVDFNIRSSR